MAHLRPLARRRHADDHRQVVVRQTALVHGPGAPCNGGHQRTQPRIPAGKAPFAVLARDYIRDGRQMHEVRDGDHVGEKAAAADLRPCSPHGGRNGGLCPLRSRDRFAHDLMVRHL